MSHEVKYIPYRDVALHIELGNRPIYHLEYYLKDPEHQFQMAVLTLVSRRRALVKNRAWNDPRGNDLGL